MRRTEYQRKFDLTCRQIEADLQSAAQSELNWLFRQVQLKIRRINRFKPTYTGPHQPLQKAYFTNIDLWDKFRTRMHVSILRALVRGYISLAVLTALKWKDLNPINFDSDEYALAVGPELGQRITHVSKTIKKLVGKKIVAWYNTPGMTMQSLVNDLSSSFNFGAYRSSLIAQTELTYLVSAISDLEAAQTGSEKWYWDSRNDQTVCTKEFIGPDGKKYKGCRELHGKIFKQGDKKPPDGSHIGCRCRPINLAGPYRKPTLETQTQIIDLPFNKAEWNEQEHPRVPAGHEGGGQFAPKGATGSLSAAALGKTQSASIFEDDQKVYERAMTLSTPEAKRMLDRLGMSREEALSKIEEAKKIQSTLKPTIDEHLDKDGHITEERMAVYQEYIDKEFSQYKPVPAGKTPHLLLTGGLPGAGKSTMLRQPMFEKVTKVSVDVDADSIRAYLAKADGLDKVGAHAASYQDETDIVVNAMLSRARDGHYNVIYDSTMKKPEALEKTIQLFKEKGYTTEAAFLEVSLENSMYRATKRYLEGVRFVDPAYIATHDHRNIETFLRLINSVDKWSHWNNEVPFGSPPELINSGKKRKHNGK